MRLHGVRAAPEPHLRRTSLFSSIVSFILCLGRPTQRRLTEAGIVAVRSGCDVGLLDKASDERSPSAVLRPAHGRTGQAHLGRKHFFLHESRLRGCCPPRSWRQAKTTYGPTATSAGPWLTRAAASGLIALCDQARSRSRNKRWTSALHGRQPPRVASQHIAPQVELSMVIGRHARRCGVRQPLLKDAEGRLALRALYSLAGHTHPCALNDYCTACQQPCSRAGEGMVAINVYPLAATRSRSAAVGAQRQRQARSAPSC